MDFKLGKFEKLLNELKEKKNLEENLSKIIRSMELEFDFQSLGIFLRVPKTDTFRLKISRNISHTYEKNTFFTQEDPLIIELLKFKLLNVTSNKHYKFEHDFSQLLIMPLHNNKILHGFIFIDSSEEIYKDENFTKFSIFSTIISLVVSFCIQRDKIQHLTDLDELTGFYTYKAFSERGEKILSQMNRYKRELVMVIFKIDNYENILRTIGKENCEDLIKQIAEVLKSDQRESDLIGKIFRDTFAIIFPETNVKSCLIPIHRIDIDIAALPLMENYKINWGVVQNSDSIQNIGDFISKTQEAVFESTRNVDENITIYRK